MLLALLSALSCGKRRPPLPPVERTPQRAELEGFQRGDKIRLSWTMPARNAPKGSILHIERVDVYRLAERVGAPRNLSEEEFASRSNLIATVPVTDDDFRLKKLAYADSLDVTGQPVRLRYAVRFVNASGQKAAFSNFLIIEPAANIAAAPRLLAASASQDALKLRWEAPEANLDGTSPVNVIGYNVYRSESERETAKLINRDPVTDVSFDDEFFEFSKDYIYFVRTVSLGKNAEPVESAESNIVRIKPVDVFPPSAPGAITLAASPQTISIFFAANPEKDILGYRVYRSSDPALPPARWDLLTPEPLKTNTFQDRSVVSGNTYYYYLTAVDVRGNVSPPSATVSERAP